MHIALAHTHLGTAVPRAPLAFGRLIAVGLVLGGALLLASVGA